MVLILFKSSISGNMEIGRFGMKLASGWDQDGNGLIVTAPYAGLGLENYGKLYYFKGFDIEIDFHQTQI